MLKITLRPSWLLAGILTLAHAAAIAVVLLVGIPLWIKIIATAVLIAQWLIVVRQRALLRGPNVALAIEITSDHEINLRTRASGWREYDVLGYTYVTPYLTILNLRQSGDRTTSHVALLPDSLEAEDFRKLRVWLRWKQDRAKS